MATKAEDKKGKDSGDMQADMSVRIQGPRPYLLAGAERVSAIERRLRGRRKGK